MLSRKLRLKKKKINNKLVLLVILLAIILILVFAIPTLAQSNDILTTSATKINNTEAWWDELWESTFNPTNQNIEGTTNLSLYAFVQPTRFILGIGLIFWLFSFGYKMIESKTIAESSYNFIRIFIPVFIALVFLSNQAYYSRVLAYGMRNITNSWSEGIMNLQITDYSIRAAIQDQLITQDAKERMVAKVQACEAMEHPEVIIPSAERPDTSDPNVSPLTPAQRKVYDYLECWEKVREYAEKELEIANEQRICSNVFCKSYRKLADILVGYTKGIEHLEKYKASATNPNDPKVLETIRIMEEKVAFSKTAFDISQGNFGILEDIKGIVVSFVNPSKQFLYFTQWMWISSLEMAMFLNGLFAPIFIALSIIPGKQNMLNFWLIETVTIGLVKMAYVIIIGLVAIQISASDSRFLDDTFFMSLGIFAPAISLVVVTAGGLAAASSFRSQSVGVAAIAAGTLSSGAATIAYSMSRAYDKRR